MYYSTFFSDAPDVELNYVDDVVTCSSDANPSASHVIIVNGTHQYTPTCILPLEIVYDTDIKCNATNTVGVGIAAIIAVPGWCMFGKIMRISFQLDILLLTFFL